MKKLTSFILITLLYSLFSYAQVKPVVQMGHSWYVESVAFSPDGRYIASGSEDKTIKLWSVENGKLIATFIVFPDASIVITPEGYFSGTGEYSKYVHFVDTKTLKVYTFDQYEERFYRPDLVKLALQGEDISKIAKLNINQVKPAPEVEIIDSPTKTNNKYITIKIKITDQGGGIGDTLIYLNKTAIKLDNTRAIKRKNNQKIVYEEYQIPLVNGKNEIQVKVYNQQKTQISRPATHIVYAGFKSITKPNLYAVIIGINQYRNPKLNLKYAKNDAVKLSKLLKEKATKSGLYYKVEIIQLTTKEETTKENILKTLKKISKKAHPKDVLIFYVASHGIVRDGKFYLLPSNVGSISTFGLDREAIDQEQLKTALINIPASKKIFIFDTCNSGKIANELQLAMLTRGLDSNTVMEIMSKSIGAMIISASKEYQEALEGYKGHGLFTYALLEGLKGKADTNNDSYLMTIELATYIYNKVPEIAKNVFKKEQFIDIVPYKDTFPILKFSD